MSWDQPFFDSIKLPSGCKLVTLRDAANYIVRLPKAEQQLPEWQTAAEVLMLVGERGGDPMVATIAMMRALNRQKPEAGPAPEKVKSLQDSSVARGVISIFARQ